MHSSYRTFESDFAWQRRFIPHMKEITGRNLIGEARDDDDRLHNTDLVVLRLETIRIACRVRQQKYLKRYANEFTIRQTRPRRGDDSELLKIMKGWGDYMLYGFAEEQGDRLCAWLLGDLRIFREWYYRQLVTTNREPGIQQENGDGSSTFRAFRIADLPEPFVRERHVFESVPMFAF